MNELPPARRAQLALLRQYEEVMDSTIHGDSKAAATVLRALGLDDLRRAEEDSSGPRASNTPINESVVSIQDPGNIRASNLRERFDRSSVPEGLRNYDPVAAARAEKEKAPPEPKPKKLWVPKADPSKCGTPAGRTVHVKRGDPVCDPCREVYNAQQSTYRKARRARAKAAKEAGK